VFARGRSSLSRPPTDQPGPVSASRMQGREPLMGYVAAAAIAIGGVLDVVVTKGKGAAAHPDTWEAYAGIVLAAAVVASVQYRNRLLSPFVAIFGAFFVTLPKGPSSLSIPHIVVLMVAVAFAVIVSMHQRRDQRALTPPMRAAGARASPRRPRRSSDRPPTGATPRPRRRPSRRRTRPHGADVAGPARFRRAWPPARASGVRRGTTIAPGVARPSPARNERASPPQRECGLQRHAATARSRDPRPLRPIAIAKVAGLWAKSATASLDGSTNEPIARTRRSHE
jgi:hypothetical protein